MNRKTKSSEDISFQK